MRERKIYTIVRTVIVFPATAEIEHLPGGWYIYQGATWPTDCPSRSGADSTWRTSLVPNRP